MSKEVKIALITTAGTLLVAIVSGVFALVNRPSPPPTSVVPGNHTPTDKGMTNYGTINLVFNQAIPQPTATPDNTSVPTSTGVYHAYDTDPNNASYTYCLAKQTNFADFTYEVQMTIVEGQAGGVFFRSQDSQNSQFSYIFLIRSDGYCGLYVVLNTASGPDFKGLVGGTITGFNKGLQQTNTIAIVARGSQIDIYVNQVGIASVTDSTYSQGGVGVIGWINSDVVFSNAKLWTV